jgi:hypothetical protein
MCNGRDVLQTLVRAGAPSETLFSHEALQQKVSVTAHTYMQW